MPISTVRAIIKSGHRLELLQTCLEKDPRLFSPTYTEEGKRGKNPPSATVGELLEKVKSWGCQVSKINFRCHFHTGRLYGRYAKKPTLLSVNLKHKHLEFAKHY